MRINFNVNVNMYPFFLISKIENTLAMSEKHLFKHIQSVLLKRKKNFHSHLTENIIFLLVYLTLLSIKVGMYILPNGYVNITFVLEHHCKQIYTIKCNCTANLRRYYMLSLNV